jgi:hypothetical protein
MRWTNWCELCEISFCAGRVAYGVAFPYGKRNEKTRAEEPTQEEFVTYEIQAYCSHIRDREFVSDIIDVT